MICKTFQLASKYVSAYGFVKPAPPASFSQQKVAVRAYVRLSWSKWSTHSRVLPSGSMEETQSMNEKALARDR